VDIVCYAWDILNDDGIRIEDFGTTDCPEVEEVALVIPAGVVVEIGIPLAWRTGDKNVYVPDIGAELRLLRGARSAEFAVDARLYGLAVKYVWLEVLPVKFLSPFVDVRSEYGTECTAETSCRFANAERQPATAAEEINGTYLMRRCAHTWTLRRSEPCVVVDIYQRLGSVNPNGDGEFRSLYAPSLYENATDDIVAGNAKAYLF
jgi:hypothetical protein